MPVQVTGGGFSETPLLHALPSHRLCAWLPARILSPAFITCVMSSPALRPLPVWLYLSLRLPCRRWPAHVCMSFTSTHAITSRFIFLIESQASSARRFKSRGKGIYMPTPHEHPVAGYGARLVSRSSQQTITVKQTRKPVIKG